MRTPVILASAMGLLLACGGPKEGDYCEDDWPQCSDDHTALWCDSGMFRPMSCPGPTGCENTVIQGQTVNSCDTRGLQPGDRCIGMFAGFIQCESMTSGLRCNGTEWLRVSCTTEGCINGETGIGTIESAGSCR